MSSADSVVDLRIVYEKVPGCSDVADVTIRVRSDAYPSRLGDIAAVGGGLCGLGEPSVSGSRVTFPGDGSGEYVVRVERA